MLEGTQPRACANCLRGESESGHSPRIRETLNWINKFGEPDVNNPHTQYLDIRYDPTCNLKCKTCNPNFSTLWQKEKNIKILPNDKNKEYLSAVNKKAIKKIYLAGGEPTYIKEYLVFLNELHQVNPSCEVIINTNLKRLSYDWKKIMSKFNNLTVTCSCDAIEDLGTYVRYPLKWTDFVDNVQWVSDNVNFLQFNLVASNLTTHRLYETCSWMKQYSKHITLSVLSVPECFTERAVPIEQRNTYINNISKLLKFPISADHAHDFRSKITYLIKKYKETPYSEILHRRLDEEIQSQDRHRTLQLQDVDRFLTSWVQK